MPVIVPTADRLSDVDIRGERPVQANGVSATRDVSIAHGRKPETQLSLAVRVRIPSHAGNALRDRGRPDTLTDSMDAYRTTFPINASSEVVWGVLVDFERYPEWNPSLPSIAGDLRVGSIVSMTLAMPGRPSPKVKAEFTEVVPQRRLVWHGNVGADWLFAGDRQFIIDPGDGDTVNFTHVEDVHGLLFPLFRAVMGRAIQRHHDALNTALTRRAEELAAEAASSQ
jgi:hypothetical protein